jgi:hypothetical protein
MTNQLELHALAHPDPRVRRLGFALHDPYVEQCWGAQLGPSGITILRRLPVLWRDAEPALVNAEDFARSVGLGGGSGVNSRFHRALDRLNRFGFAEWTGPDRLGVYTEVGPLSPRQLSQLPACTVDAHDRLLGRHLDGIAGASDRSTKVAEVTARLDRIQFGTTNQVAPTTALQR